MKWNRQEISLGSGLTKQIDMRDDVINALVVTVTAGDLYVYFGMRDSGQPDLRFTPGDTRVVPLPPNNYQMLTCKANGATTSAVVYPATL
jgi:DNA-directed RNA polymerase alpha subunit